LRLLPQNAGNYAICTVPLSNQDSALAALYDVDFQANHLYRQMKPSLQIQEFKGY